MDEGLRLLIEAAKRPPVRRPDATGVEVDWADDDDPNGDRWPCTSCWLGYEDPWGAERCGYLDDGQFVCDVCEWGYDTRQEAEQCAHRHRRTCGHCGSFAVAIRYDRSHPDNPDVTVRSGLCPECLEAERRREAAEDEGGS